MSASFYYADDPSPKMEISDRTVQFKLGRGMDDGEVTILEPAIDFLENGIRAALLLELRLEIVYLLFFAETTYLKIFNSKDRSRAIHINVCQGSDVLFSVQSYIDDLWKILEDLFREMISDGVLTEEEVSEIFVIRLS
ncbi:hypothetical protein [Parerythrobacter lacustris]|uniref:Uncharacterized protein n=1 Tax=Parerythrobacter lacustris TaxID=2969984 RepID=A0ABT1XU61_9SPHN|nr:hypothetical protein [Parerythrobacter lacustris]MCR2835194.1 hypothetical protein [Parerythrobacter lacustris]